MVTDLGLSPGNKRVALFAFNLGVELGPLAAVAFFLAVLFGIRQTSGHVRVAFPVGSTIVLVIGVPWFIQRATGTSLLFA